MEPSDRLHQLAGQQSSWKSWDFLAIQWCDFRAFTAEGMGWIPLVGNSDFACLMVESNKNSHDIFAATSHHPLIWTGNGVMGWCHAWWHLDCSDRVHWTTQERRVLWSLEAVVSGGSEQGPGLGLKEWIKFTSWQIGKYTLTRQCVSKSQEMKGHGWFTVWKPDLKSEIGWGSTVTVSPWHHTEVRVLASLFC